MKSSSKDCHNLQAGKRAISLSESDEGEKEKDTYEKRQRLWDKLPEKLQKQLLEQRDKQLRKEGIDPLTGLPKGVTQDEFDDGSRATRLPLPTPGVDKKPDSGVDKDLTRCSDSLTSTSMSLSPNAKQASSRLSAEVQHRFASHQC